MNALGAVALVVLVGLLAFSFFWIPAPFNAVSMGAGLVLFALFFGGFGIPRR